MADTTANTYISLAHTEEPAQTNEDEGQEGQEGQEEYTNLHQFPEGEGVSVEYGEYNEEEWGAEGHEEAVPVEQVEPPATGQVVGQGHAGTIETGTPFHRALERENFEWLVVDEVSQYDGEEYIGPEYEYIYNETEDAEGEVGEWAGGSFPFFPDGTLFN